MEVGLKKKTVKGFGWSFAENAITHGFRFIVGLVLARILSPHDFGLVGIALIFVNILDALIDGGFTNAIIQKKHPVENDYSTAFVTNLFISCWLYVFIFMAAPYIAKFFDEPSLKLLTRVISTILLIDALIFVPRTRLTKQMNFKVQTKISLASAVISAIVGIGMAYMGFGVWSLVGQQITRHLVNSLLFLLLSKWSMSLNFSRRSFSSLFAFGSRLIISDFINSVYKQLYQVVIGKFYSPATLGQYSRANQFAELPSLTFSQMIQKVSFPALASLQDQKDKLREAYRTLVKSTMFIEFIIMFSLAAIAKPMILVLIGPKWLEAVPYLQIMCLYMALYPLHDINLNMLKVTKRSDLYLKIEIIKKFVGVIPLLLGIFIGIYWMLAGAVVENIIAYILNSYYSRRFVGYSTAAQVRDILPSFMLASIVAAIAFSLQYLQLNITAVFALQLIVIVALTFILSELLKLESYMNVKDIVKEFISKSRKMNK